MTRPDCLPSLLGYVDKSIEKVALKNICTGPTREGKKGQKSLVPAGPLSNVLLESPFQNPLRPTMDQQYKAEVTFSICTTFYVGDTIEHACSSVGKIEKNMQRL